VRDFRVIFPDARKGKQNGVSDTPIIKLCHDNLWLLLTHDHEMSNTHIEEIKKHPHVTILATAHGCGTAEDNEAYFEALISLKPTILRMFKNEMRPWFATFSKRGHITSKRTITEHHGTRRTRQK
jgi:hypothetical protein